ncbi:MAG: TonB-dependent receptor, partial [Verrucomicrobia bacterium]|nr:TonB-dependent receptor [Verrucomicrobiota bacterium]
LASGQTINAFGILTVETKWSSSVMSMLSLGYNDFRYSLPQTNSTFYTPGNNPTGQWALGVQPFDQSRPGRNKAIRYNVLFLNKFFRGRLDSQTVLGADYSRNDSANITYSWFLADSSWNPVRSTVLGNQQGRTQVPAQIYPIAGGIVKYPLWAPRTPRVTINGVNYLRMLSNEVQPHLIGPNNPLGINGTSNYQQTKLMNRGVYLANYSDWFGGRFTTMLGARYANQFGRGATNTYSAVVTSETTNYNFGLNYRLNDWLYPYYAVSSSYQPPVSFNPGPYRTPPKLGHAVGQEGGIKFNSRRGGISGSLAYYHTNAVNEAMSVSSTIFNYVNPNGINGRYGGSASNWVNVNRVTKGVEAAITASPTPNWRLRLSAARTKGSIKNGLTLPLMYNDRFHANTAGQVTYADRTVVYVNPTFNANSPVATASTPGAVPLTIAMMNDPNSVYYANPVVPSGQIRSTSNVARVLDVVDPVHGPIATGETGLPMSSVQIDTRHLGFTPPEQLTAIVAGERTAGYPLYSGTLTSLYTFRREGWLKGFRFGGTLSASWDRLAYFYYPNINTSLDRERFRTPVRGQFDLILGYERKFRRVHWSTQLNVYNVFNHYEWIVTPSSINGWRTISSLGASMIGTPRAWQLSTAFNF